MGKLVGVMTEQERLARNEKQLAYHHANKERLNALRNERVRKRKLEDPEYAAKEKERLYAIHLRSMYDISPEERHRLYEEQAGCCAICREPREEYGKSGLRTDHNHETGTVRGLLCPNCNTALGLLGEDEDRMIRAMIYLMEREE